MGQNWPNSIHLGKATPLVWSLFPEDISAKLYRPEACLNLLPLLLNGANQHAAALKSGNLDQIKNLGKILFVCFEGGKLPKLHNEGTEPGR